MYRPTQDELNLYWQATTNGEQIPVGTLIGSRIATIVTNSDVEQEMMLTTVIAFSSRDEEGMSVRYMRTRESPEDDWGLWQ